MIPLLCCLATLVLYAALRHSLSRMHPRHRLEELSANDEPGAEQRSEIDWARGAALPIDRLARAGFVTPAERRKAVVGLTAVVLICTGLGAVFAASRGTGAAVLGGALGAYFGGTAALLLLAARASEQERRGLFQLPLVMESVVLLVEAGFGVLPALEQVVNARSRMAGAGGIDPTTRALRLVYELSAHGMPLANALELAAQRTTLRPLAHALLHLDVSSSDGGELIPSLRSLSEHTHSEWRLSVESRVSRLENLVVFPVFASVMGLMILTASVPIVSVRDFMRSLDRGAPAAKAALLQPERRSHD